MSLGVFIALAVVACCAMEPVTAATHRWVMHGFGTWFHRSHHVAPGTHAWERNDWYPVMFASIVMLGLWFGFHHAALAPLIPAGVGVTTYGAAYALVHDGYIHRRIGVFGGRRFRLLDRLADAHRIHHLYNRAPFGMLVPIVPRRLRRRAATSDRDPLPRVPVQNTKRPAVPGPV